MMQNDQPPTIPPCPLCGGLRVEGYITSDVLWMLGNPASFAKHDFKALLCTGCGYTTMFVLDVEQLRRDIEEQRLANEKRRAKEAEKQRKQGR